MSKIAITSRRGRIEVSLYESDAPAAVSHILKLIDDRFYDGLVIHRVVRDALTQTGCPNGDGSGDSGVFLPAEKTHHRLLTGSLALAKNEDGVASSQFFMCWRPLPDLDGEYTVFGRITRGIDVLYRLREGDAIQSISRV